MTNPIIALIGNPNCGKTTLFNALTGANQRTGNWPGVTVDRKEGQFKCHDLTITLVDLPGVYSLDAEESATGIDELVARDYLLSGEPQLVINIVDASNLERNLYLTTQLIEMGLPMVIVVNMMDVAQKRGIQIDHSYLAQTLGIPIVPLVATDRHSVRSLVDWIVQGLEQPISPLAYIAYPAVIEEALESMVPKLGLPAGTISPRWTAVNLLQYDERVAPAPLTPELIREIGQHRRTIHEVLGEDIDILIADSRYGFIQTLTRGATNRLREIHESMSDRLDQIFLNRWLGIPIFLGVMYVMFLLVINVGSAFIDFFELTAGTLFVDGCRQILAHLRFPGWAIALIADGAGGGIQTVSTFIPVIGFMFFFLSILEDSGYMARAAFVMDRLMRLIGLPGKSFVPMLVGFGCNVPAIMAARTLENSRDRMMTILMNPFMSCGARLPVYALFAAAFFPVGGQNIVFGLYLLGIGFAILTGLVMKHTLLKGEISPFVMELPPYHLPRLKGVLLRTWDRLRAFLWRAGKVIVLMVTILGLLNSLGTDGSFGNQDTDKSVLSSASQTLTPMFAPMGIRQENWPATVGIFTGVFAKEAMVGTLDAVYSQLAIADHPELEQTETTFSLWGGLTEAIASIPANLAEVPSTLLDPLGLNIGDTSDITTASESQEVAVGTFGAMVRRFDGQVGAFAYLLFVLLYFPCVSATAAVYRETNWRWTIFVATWTTGLAYMVSTSFYQITRFDRHPLFSSVWLLAMAGIAIATFFLLKMIRPLRRTPSPHPLTPHLEP